MRGEVKRLQEDLGITSVYVTHDQVEAMTMASRIAVMNKGVLQAYGTPEQLYERPDTLFVAGFIGAPPMNFISATFVKGEEGYTLRTSSFAIPLPEEKGRVAEANNAPSQVIMGIRPEDVRVVSEGGDIQAEVYVVEPLGREDLVTFKFDQEKIRVLVPAPFRGQVGQVMRLELNKEKIHLFDPETQRSLLRRE